MKIHIRECDCGNLSVRLDGSAQWETYQHDYHGLLDRHEALSRERYKCEKCERLVAEISHVASTVGSVH